MLDIVISEPIIVPTVYTIGDIISHLTENLTTRFQKFGVVNNDVRIPDGSTFGKLSKIDGR